MTALPTRNHWALWTITLTLLSWSSIPLFLRHFTAHFDPYTTNGWRYAIAAAAWLPALLWTVVRRRTPRGLWRAAVWPSVFNCGGQFLFGLAPYYVMPGLMTFGLRLQIVFVAVGAALLFPSERRLLQQPRYLLSLAAVFLGTISIVLLRSSKDATTIGADREFLGFLLALASGLGFGMYGLAVRRSLNDVPAWLGFAVVSQYTAAFMLIVMFIASPAEWSAPISADSALIALLAASAVIGIWLAHFLYFYSIRHLGLATAAGVVQLQPFVVGLASLALYNERLSAAQWLSGGVAVSGAAGMLFVQWQHTRE